MLNTLRHGPDSATRPPLLIAHGLFGSGRNWGAIARRLAIDRQVLAVDLRNHGESFWSPRHDYPALADDLAKVIAAHGGRADVLGHSMGGKAAMVLALVHPEMVNRLIVADIAPIAYDHSQTQHIAAMRGLDIEGLSGRADADQRLSATVDDPALRAFFLQSLDLKTTPARWRLNFDALEAEMPKILGWPALTAKPDVPDQIAEPPQFHGPVLFLAGAQSNYIRPEHRPEIKALFPNAIHAKIPGAGHWLHAERPREFEAAVATFLDPPR